MFFGVNGRLTTTKIIYEEVIAKVNYERKESKNFKRKSEKKSVPLDTRITNIWILTENFFCFTKNPYISLI